MVLFLLIILTIINGLMLIADYYLNKEAKEIMNDMAERTDILTKLVMELERKINNGNEN